MEYHSDATGVIPSPRTPHTVQYSGVVLVDPEDDSLLRYVIWHYRFDAARRERRNVIVAAYDNETEFVGQLQRLDDELKRRQAVGDAEVVENISGVVKRPGVDAEQRRQRALRGPSEARARVRRRHRAGA